MDLIENDFIIEEDLLKEIEDNWVQQHFDFDQRDLFIRTLHNREIKYYLHLTIWKLQKSYPNNTIST